MLNKKILAAAIASAFSLNAVATVDLDATDQTVTYATQALGTVTDGLFTADNTTTDGATGALANTFDATLDVRATLGFTIGNGTSKYVRVNLTNAEFGAAPVLTITNGTVAVAQGGTPGDDFVIFEIAASADIPASATYILEAASYDVSATEASTLAVATYETAADAVNESNSLYSDSVIFTDTASANDGSFATAGTATATVASQFITFVDRDTPADGIEEEEANIGSINSNDLLVSGILTNAGATVAIGDIIDVDTPVTLTGDVSFGDWFLSAAPDCSVVTQQLVEDTDTNASATSASFDTAAAGLLYVCVDNTAEDTILKGSYTISLDDDEIENDAGQIVYNTTSIEVPYLTTFSGLNQRVYIINNGPSDALYTMSFTSEDGVTTEAGSAATGTVPAGEMVALKATDIVTITGKTRTSAVIEIEADDSNVSAATQTVNLSDGTTDTVVLN